MFDQALAAVVQETSRQAKGWFSRALHFTQHNRESEATGQIAEGLKSLTDLLAQCGRAQALLLSDSHEMRQSIQRMELRLRQLDSQLDRIESKLKGGGGPSASTERANKERTNGGAAGQRQNTTPQNEQVQKMQQMQQQLNKITEKYEESAKQTIDKLGR